MTDRLKRGSFSALPFLITLLLVLAGCGDRSEQRPFVVRIGSDYLYEDELERALEGLASEADRNAARDSYVDQWITTALLAAEAREEHIDADPAVQSQLADNERSVLATAAIERMYSDEVPEPTHDELLRYYESVKQSLVIREDYIRVRYLRSPDPDSAAAARRLLQRAMRGGGADSLWGVIAHRYAEDPTSSTALGATYVADSDVFAELPGVGTALGQLGKGQIASVIEEDAAWHVVQLVDRVPAGSTPEASWITRELTRRLQLQRRNEAYARKIQRLRTEADSRSIIHYGSAAVRTDDTQ